MDLTTVATITPARTRDDLAALGATVAPLAGGSELFADPRIHLTGLVDLQTMGWPALTITADGLEIAATCTLAELSRLPAQPGWVAHPVFHQACTALFGSFKVWNVATVGGNLCTSLPAGPMICLTAALDAEVLIWRADGTDERMPALGFVTGNTTNVLDAGDVLRSIHVPAAALAARTAYRKIALLPLGRSGAVLIGRHRRRLRAHRDRRHRAPGAAALPAGARRDSAGRRHRRDRRLVHGCARRRRLAPRRERSARRGDPPGAGRAGPP